ncbi:8554_t:CDS:1 [Ambispora leptoticha]|uniref:8554_t:CDS:1 n=1 Tax=Ambispora leptoticha TaxID=144679 RepID=A0A9N9CSZ8_9GLOM|nr:8554_t:CDS:1 [Ambispora leptoticha]
MRVSTTIGTKTVSDISQLQLPVKATSPSGAPTNPKYFMYFTFSGTNQAFQSGYLGITNSCIQGTLHIKSSMLKQPLLAKQIVLTLKCVQFAHWSAGRTRVSASLKTLDLSQTLFTSNDPKGYQLLNDCEFPFVFPLPATAVGSLHTDACRIEYQLDAKLKRKKVKWYQLSSRAEWTLLPVLWYAFPTMEMYQPAILSNTDSKIQWSFSIPKKHVAPNEVINARLNITFLNPSISIKSIEYGLKTYMYVRAGKWSFTGKLRMTKAKGMGNEFTGDLLIKVPGDVISTTNGPLIKVEHKIKVKVSLSGAKDIEIEQPVIASNVMPTELHQQLLRAQNLISYNMQRLN